MNKINIEINFPLIQKRININIPINKTIEQILILIQKNYDDIPYYQDNKSLVVLNGLTGDYLDISQMVKDSPLRNGSAIIIL